MLVKGEPLAGQRRMVGVVMDVTGPRRRENALRVALSDRELQVREADHRIKNSLQLVTSLLRLQLRRVSVADAKDAVAAAMARVTAVADVHEALQRSPDMRSVRLDRLLHDLCGNLAVLHPEVVVRCEASVCLHVDADVAIPLGLIASELLTNALRHAFRPGEAGTVTLTATSECGFQGIADTDSNGRRTVIPTQAGQ